jgi:hypothetical protein
MTTSLRSGSLSSLISKSWTLLSYKDNLCAVMMMVFIAKKCHIIIIIIIHKGKKQKVVPELGFFLLLLKNAGKLRVESLDGFMLPGSCLVEGER